jgi:phage terminase large subunit GpA-like protein
MRVWVNTFLAETWAEDGDRVEIGELEARAEGYTGDKLPDGVLLLVAAVDCQSDRLVAEVVGWGRGEESWGVEFRTLPGRPDDPGTWDKLEAFLGKTWARADGQALRVVACGVDYGYFSDYVLKWTRRRFARGVLAVKGSNIDRAPIVSAVKRNNRYKAATMSVGTDQAKSLIFARLKANEEGAPGRVHFPGPAMGYDSQFYSELTAEELRLTFTRGFARREWHKTRPRNEALDLRVYGQAMLRWLNPDWDRLAKGKKSDVPKEPGPPGDWVPGRRAVSSGQNAPVGPAPARARGPGVRSFVRGWRRF